MHHLKKLSDEDTEAVEITSPNNSKTEKNRFAELSIHEKYFDTCQYDCGENNVSVRSLPENKMSSLIQKHVDDVLQKEKCKPEVGEILIRNIYSRDCFHEVETKFLMKFPDYAKTVHYRKKGMLAFQVFKGKELLFFGFEVDEYRNQPSPNDKNVHFTWLDSIKLGIQRQFRTKVYQEILNGVYKYFRYEGFEHIFIHAEPPTCSTDQEYMFIRHPETQLIPTPDGLTKWYKNVFSSGKRSDCLDSHTDMLTHLNHTNSVNLSHVPYFWLCYIDNFLEELKDEVHDNFTEEIKLKKYEKYLEDSELSEDSFISDEDSDTWAIWLMQNCFKQYNQLLVVNLQSDMLVPIEIKPDEDSKVKNFFFENRNDFISFQKSNDLKFSDKSNALCSTKALAYKLLEL